MRYSHSFYIYPSSSNRAEHIREKYFQLLRNTDGRIRVKYTVLPCFYFKRSHINVVRESIRFYPILIVSLLLGQRFLLEINGNPINEQRLRAFTWLLERGRSFIVGHPNCVAFCFSPDEARACDGIPISVTNNVSIRSLSMPKLPRPNRVLCLIGSNRIWHGLAEIHTLASAMGDFQFDIWGCERPRELRELKNVTWYSSASIEVIEGHNYGYAIGSLGYHHKGIGINSSLKGVDYHMLNLPFVQSFEELNAAVGFVLCETNPCPANVRAFFLSWKDKRLQEHEVDQFSIQSHLRFLTDLAC